MRHNGNVLQLRRFSSQDATTIIGWPQSLREAQWWAGPQTRWPLTPEAMQRWHYDSDTRPYVFHSGASILGYGELWLDAEEQDVELARLTVAPAQRGQGLGVALVRLLLEETGRIAYPLAFLRVFPLNRVAIACFLRAGFTLVSPAEQQAFNRGQAIDYLWMGHSLYR